MYNSLFSFLEWKQWRRRTNQHLIYHCIPIISEVTGESVYSEYIFCNFCNVLKKLNIYPCLFSPRIFLFEELLISFLFSLLEYISLLVSQSILSSGFYLKRYKDAKIEEF